MKSIDILTNVDWFERRTVGNTLLRVKGFVGSNVVSCLKTAFEHRSSRAIVINSGTRELLVLCLMRQLLPWWRVKLISVDLILSKPYGFKARILARLKAFLLRQVDHFVLYMKDWSGYERYYGINKGKFKYIPFKVNSYEYVMGKSTADEGYIFTGGVSKRDYRTLFRAVSGLPYHVKVLVPPNSISGVHGTTVSRQEVPENVSIIHDDGSPESWIDHIAKARLVVLPIDRDTISPTGVSTYLLAMALRKCVIISEGPASRNVVPAGAAVTVTPGDAEELRSALVRAYEDDRWREGVARRGYDYAATLKDHERLVDDIARFVAAVV